MGKGYVKQSSKICSLHRVMGVIELRIMRILVMIQLWLVLFNFTFMLRYIVMGFFLNNQPDALIVPILLRSILTLFGSGHQKTA